MAKKNLPSNRRASLSRMLGYTLPVYHESGKSSYVDFYYLDPATDTMRRKKYSLGRYKTKMNRRLHANELIATLILQLRKGWNPSAIADTDRGYTRMSDVIERYLQHVDKTCRARTRENYHSRINILREYISSRHTPIEYAGQFDATFCTEYLDWILLDRGVSPRTRNNYLQWLASFGEWMHARKYIPENPTNGIQKISENPKKRQQLSKEMLQQLHGELRGKDDHFLLACMMLYFTMIRPTELSYIRINDIKLKDKKIFVSGRFAKNKRDGYVGLNDTLIKLMLDNGVFAHPGESYLFSKHFKPGDEHIDADQFQKRWTKLRQKLKWGKEYQFYSLKDTGITDLANSAGIVVARDQARHSDIATTNKYLGATKKVHAETQTFKGGWLT